MGTLTVDNINVNSNITGGKINNPSWRQKVVITGIVWWYLDKVTFDTELFDTNGNFASSRFTPTVGGQYYFCADLHHYNSASGATTIRNTALYKNGSVHTHTLRTENSGLFLQ